MHGKLLSKRSIAHVISVLLGLCGVAAAQGTAALPGLAAASDPSNTSVAISASDLGITFVDESKSEILLHHNGQTYLVNVADHTVRAVNMQERAGDRAHLVKVAHRTMEQPSGTSSSVDHTGSPIAASGQGQPTTATPAPEQKKKPNIYTPGDDLVFSVPTGRRLERHGLYINFSHRFAFESAFTGTGRGNTLLGLDDFSVSSFGFRYGITSKLSAFVYRSPSVIGRPIEFMAAYNFLDESDGKPLNAAVRLSIDGQNNFANNYTENLELTLSRSLGHRAQLYAVPTFSFHNRPVLGDISAPLQNSIPLQSCKLALAAGVNPALKVHPCANTVSLGLAASVDIRPTVAIVAEAIPTLANGPELGIHRSPFSFGIQKKIWRHAFTLGFTNSPGTTVANRAGTNATFMQQPGADKPSAMFIGFDLTRQVY